MDKPCDSSASDLSLTLACNNEQVMDSDRLYREMFLHAPIGIVRTSLDGQLLEANDAFYRLLGYHSKPDNGEQASIGSFYVDLASRSHLLRSLQENGAVTNYPVCFKGKDGTEVNCHLHVRTAHYGAGEATYFEAFVENVDQQIKTAQQLQRSEARYRSIFENTGAGTMIIEEDTTISMVNSGFTKLFGYTREETENKMKWPELIADNEARQTMLRYHYSRRRNSTSVPLEYEFALRDKEGQLRNIFLRVNMIEGTTSSVASLFDITSLKTVRRHLKDSEIKLTSIVEAFEGFIYATTTDFTLTFTNNALQNFIGRHGIGEKCHKAIYGQDEVCGWCPADRLFAGETVKKEIQSPISGRWYYSVSSPSFDEKHGITEYQTVLLDIHDRKHSEELLREKELMLERENVRLKATIKERYRFGSIIGKSQAMQKIYQLILRAAASDANVIIYGESGTGKELVAKEIHDLSERAQGQFVAVNCSAVPEELMESEFFGYVKGAFTGAEKDKQGIFATASGGTLFLDELGDISEKLQVKLLRALEGGGYTPIGSTTRQTADVRIIAATNKNLAELIDKGQMREDFFYRIHILPIELPPLRARKNDIPLLIEHFLKKYKTKTPLAPLTGHDFERLMRYDWPGNIRELENTIQRYVNLRYLEFSDVRSRKAEFASSKSAAPIRSLGQAVEDFERDYLVKVLTDHQWNRTRVANMLGIERKTLYLKLKKLGIGNQPTN